MPNPRMLAVLTLVAAVTAVAQRADIIFINGNIWTVDSLRPTAEAVAVFGGKVLSVGTTAAIKRLASSRTKVVDLKKKLLLPGFIDDHTHFMSGGFQLESVNLRYADSREEFARLIAERAKSYPARWITGGDWDHDRWKGGPLPTKELIDAFTPNTPVFVNRYDGHMALANSVVLKLAGITRATPNPPGGVIVKDTATGEPTGVLKDEAMSFVYNIIPRPSDSEMIDAARLALAEARTYGVTSVQDISSQDDLKIYQRLKANGELTARFYSRLPIALCEHVIATGIHVPFGDEWIKLGSLKAFADGSLGSTTALFFQPYLSDPSTHGLATDIVLDGRLARWAMEADRAGLQLSVHSIGDSANSLMLDLFEKAVRENPSWDRRFRLEHAQHIHPKDFERMARLGVVASVQPYHAIDDGRWAEQRIGHERCATTYPFRSFLDHHIMLCFGSDWTVAPINPLLGIYAAVTRRTIDGANPGGWFPEQKIAVKEAIKAYTINNAYAAFEEHEKGSITEGKLADFVLLSKNILTIDPTTIDSVTVVMTVVGGKIVYKK